MSRPLRRIGLAALGCALLGLILTTAVGLISRRTAWITLPDDAEAGFLGVHDPAGEGTPSPVLVTPRTVQAAIATLSRPEDYCRSVQVSHFWSGGSGSYTARVTVSAQWTRVDLEQPGGLERHSLTDGETAYIWYGSSRRFYEAPAGGITGDDEQHIPTYEDVLALSPEAVTAAGYEVRRGVRCLYAEAAEENRRDRYWISVEDGLLWEAETLLDGETVYAMQSLGEQAAADDAFTLPDGTQLLTEFVL